MNYKQIVDNIELVCINHKMINDFGYGQLSDIKILDESGDGADYPYAFLVPGSHSRVGQSMAYSFNLIMMEMAKTPSHVLKIQSDMMEILHDVIGYLKSSDPLKDVELNIGYQVFRERFQDEVAGATATIEMDVPLPIRNVGDTTGCDDPFAIPELGFEATLGGGQQLRYYNTIVQAIPRGPEFTGEWYAVFEGSVQNLNTLPEDPGRIILQSGNQDIGYTDHVIEIDASQGAINTFQYRTPNIDLTGDDFNFIMNFGDESQPDVPNTGQSVGIQSIKLYKV